MGTAYDNFYTNLLPGNYALTKSMELSRVNTSGTLWYIKKFLVLYYYIFLSNDIETRQYITKATEYFDKYIADLDDSVKDVAFKFFYPDNEVISLKSDRFKSFSDFIGHRDFENMEERNAFIALAKKYYFAFLMESGGQSGVKKRIKESMYQDDFLFSIEELRSIIKDFFSDKDDDINYTGYINDYMAFLRNERQILYYYGFFHSKTSGATDKEFSSLTPIGEMALEANSKEFQCIWEHQKFKMISQPVTVEIDNVYPDGLDLDNFSLSFNPYLDIIEFLLRNSTMSREQYQFIVSRMTRDIDKDEWIREEDEILSKLPEIKARVTSFNRTRDISTEDANKELLKYILGLRDDLKKDEKTNILGCLKIGRNGVEVTSYDILSKLYNIYRPLNEYKLSTYGDLFISCEDELRNKYISSASDGSHILDPKIKINWDLYNIKPDKCILLGIIVASILIQYGIEFSTDNARDIAQIAIADYKTVLSKLGLRTLNKTKDTIDDLITAINDSNFEDFIEDEDDYVQNDVRSAYLHMSTVDLFTKIKETSMNTDNLYSADRKRNKALIGLIKSYYIKRFSQGNVLKCECCQNETFVTSNNEPYIELHHLIPFSGVFKGPDHYLNIYGLCPTCHRIIHYARMEEKKDYYKMLNENNHYKQSFVTRLKDLYGKRVLQSYQLEYLVADCAISQEEYDFVLS